MRAADSETRGCESSCSVWANKEGYISADLEEPPSEIPSDSASPDYEDSHRNSRWFRFFKKRIYQSEELNSSSYHLCHLRIDD